jgi:hypothetical protein
MSPATGRFAGRDSWSGSLRTPITLHRYLYANADPANKIDPTGGFATSLIEINSVLCIQNSLRVAAGFERFASYLNSAKAVIGGVQIAYDLLSVASTVWALFDNGPGLSFQKEWTIPSSQLFFEDRFEVSLGTGIKNVGTQRLWLLTFGLSAAKSSGKGGVKATFALDPVTFDLNLAESRITSSGSIVLTEIRPRFSLGDLVPLRVLGTVGVETSFSGKTRGIVSIDAQVFHVFKAGLGFKAPPFELTAGFGSGGGSFVF